MRMGDNNEKVICKSRKFLLHVSHLKACYIPKTYNNRQRVQPSLVPFLISKLAIHSYLCLRAIV